MAAVPRYRLKQTPTDTWSIRERLCLASSVLRSGDQNWVSVSRAIKSFGEPNRPPDWFSQKNCALQYSDQLEKIEAPKKKRWDRADKETPGDLIVRKLTIERIDELKKLIQEKQQRHRKLKRDIEMIKSGQMDDKLDEIWSQIQDEMKAKEQAEKDHQKWLQDREARIAALKAMPRVTPLLSKKKIPIKVPRVGELRRNSSQSEQSEQDSAVESPISEPLSVEVEDAVSPLPSSVTHEGPPATPTKFTGMAPPAVTTPTSQHPTPSTSPLLTSLLKSPTPATPASPISSVLVSPTQQPKEGTIATPQASPRPTSAPQTFFNPTSALATAAARQLAVATASVSPNVASLFSSDKSDSSGKAESSVNLTPPIHSVTSSAPTLSKLLEMPPSIPGKLPPLPIVRPPETTLTTINVATTVTSTQAEPCVPVVSKEVLPVSIGSTASTDIKKEKKIKAETMSPPPQIPEVERTTEINEENAADQAEVNSKSDANVNAELKEEVETEEIQQVIVMEVDFAGEEIKGDKGEIIEEVFEVTAPEGSIVEVEYETISDDGACKEEFITLPVKEKPATPPEESTEEVSVKEIIPITSEVIVEDKNESQKVIEDKEEIKPEKVEDEKVDETVKEVKIVKEEPPEQIPPEEPAAEKVPTDKVEEVTGKKEVIEEKEETVDSSSVKSEEIIVRSVKRPGRKGKRNRGRGGKILLPDFEVESTSSPLPEEEKEEKQAEKEKVEETHTEESTREETPELKLVESVATPDTLEEVVEEATTSDSRDEKLEAKKAEETNNYEAIVESPATKDEGSFQQMQTGEESISEDKYKPPSSVSDSIPNSPASTSQSDDQESLREYKVWKKAIMLVWRAAANHKFANVFLHPVTNDVAPGYHSIVYSFTFDAFNEVNSTIIASKLIAQSHVLLTRWKYVSLLTLSCSKSLLYCLYRPMDLSVIKKNIENGVIKTTIEFQRDMMLMFQNAIMYNSSDHDVFHMALEMQKEVMEQIQDFLATQLMVQTADTKVLRGRERETRDRKSESTDKEEETKRKRTSTSTSDSESKPKKRKIL